MAEETIAGGQAPAWDPAATAAAGETGWAAKTDPAGGGTGGEGKQTTDPDPTKAWWEMIPSHRLKEEADKRREAETKLAEYQEKERKEEEKKKMDQWKHKEIIETKDQEIVTLKAENAKIPQYDAAIIASVTAELATIETTVGKEKLDKILGMLNFEAQDALSKLASLTKVKEFVAELSPANTPKWWQGIPASKSDPADPSKPQSFNDAVKNIFGG